MQSPPNQRFTYDLTSGWHAINTEKLHLPQACRKRLSFLKVASSMPCFWQISKTQLGARPRPLQVSEPVGFLYLAFTRLRLSRASGFGLRVLATCPTAFLFKACRSISCIVILYFLRSARISVVASWICSRRLISASVLASIFFNCGLVRSLKDVIVAIFHQSVRIEITEDNNII